MSKEWKDDMEDIKNFSVTEIIKSNIGNIEYWLKNGAKIADWLDIKYNQGRIDAYKNVLSLLESRNEK